LQDTSEHSYVLFQKLLTTLKKATAPHAMPKLTQQELEAHLCGGRQLRENESRLMNDSLGAAVSNKSCRMAA
jgi:hypothetical protein